jgi:hypothetical protein
VPPEDHGRLQARPGQGVGKEAVVEPLPLYVRSIARQQVLGSETQPVTGVIKQACNKLWIRHQPRRGRRPPRPPTPMESLLNQARAAAREATEASGWVTERRNRRQGGGQEEVVSQPGRDRMDAKELMRTWRETEWKRQWLLAS